MTPDRAECYQPHLGTPFTLPEAGLSILLEVVEPFASAATEGFALRFTGPRQPRVAQGIHRLDHAGLGPVELFMVPVQDPRAGMTVYEAIFNRLRPASPERA